MVSLSAKVMIITRLADLTQSTPSVQTPRPLTSRRRVRGSREWCQASFTSGSTSTAAQEAATAPAELQ
jgi:hypothetical protein